MSDQPASDKKLHVDEDWKSQVEAEKLATQQADEPKQPPKAPQPSRGPLPPASLTLIVSTLYLQGIVALGLIPNPVTKKAEADQQQAKHAIDLLAVLQQKTEGNRTPEETEEIEAALHELRMAFVQTEGRG
jgi:hypothetical protein